MNLGIPTVLVIFSLLVGFTYKILRNVSSQIKKEIDNANAKMGLDKSIESSDLMKDFLIPFKDSSLDEYADNNNLTLTRYEEDLKREVNIKFPVGVLALHFLILLYWFVSILSKISLVEKYVFISDQALIILTFIDFIVYLNLRLSS